jgi:hypothetical protein
MKKSGSRLWLVFLSRGHQAIQEILKKIRKYFEISGNTCKFQEILGNFRKYKTKNMKYLENALLKT